MDQAALGWARRRLWQALGRDGLTRASEDEGRQVELCRYMWWVRHLALATALVAGLRDGEAGRPELLVAVMLVLQLAGYSWSIVLPRHGGAVVVVDAVAFLVLSALGLDPRLVLVIAVAALGTAATFRPVPAVAAYLGVLGAVGLMLRRPEGPTTGAVLAAFCLLGGIFMMRTIRLNIGARRAAERDRLVSERVDAVLWEEVPGTDTVKVSPGAERLLGHPVADWARPGFWREIVHPADLPRWAPTGPAAPAGGPQPVRLRHADGSWRWLESRTTSVTDRQGRHAFTVGVLLDRTEQVEAEREALAFGQLVATSPIGQILLACHDGRAVVEAVNAACQRALGLPDDAVGSVLADHPTPGFAARDLLDRLLTDGAGSVEFTGADGRTYQADGHRVESHVCKIDVIDVTERVEAGRLLHRQARQDELTGLPNRRAFIEDVAGHLAGRAADRSVEPTALLVLDLDGFREVNDSLGHDTGDELLRSVARRIRAGLGEAELAARLGGDEFALLLPGLAAEAATARGLAVLEAIGAPLEVGDIRLRMRASLGFAVHPVDAADAEELLRRANTAMQHARSAGTVAQHYDAATHRAGAERVALVGDLHAAITAGQLLLHHQPLIALPTGRIVGTEALVRWQHPTLGMIPPDRFIELAEGSGQIKPLTRWVVRQALTDLHGLGDAGRDLEVSVNLSVHNLYEVDFLDWLTGTLTELGLSGERLVVEITESSVMVDPEAAVRRIEGLRDLGVRTWIDDFGTGHSSLARLCRLPVDGVKIDRAFVTDAAASRRDRDVLTHLVGLVRSLGLATVAEGVEHADCLAALRELGCDLAQGFHIARPMPIDRFGALLGAGPLPVPRPRTAGHADQVPLPGP